MAKIEAETFSLFQELPPSLPPELTELITPPQTTIEVTPANIAGFFREKRFADLSWLPYFSGQYSYGKVPSEELLPGERLELIIPEMIIKQRVTVFVERLASIIIKDPQKYALGAILEGGYPLYDEALEAVLKKSVWGRHTFLLAHADIKSHWSSDSGKEEIKALPHPDIVNGTIYFVFEGVIDSAGTVNALRSALSKPPYYEVQVVIISLTDKIGARPPESQILSPNTLGLFGLDNFWMCGKGPDAKKGRARLLPGGGVARYYSPTEI